MFTVIVTIIAVAFAACVCIYSYRQYRKEKKPKMDFIRELFNHLGDSVNMKR